MPSTNGRRPPKPPTVEEVVAALRAQFDPEHVVYLDLAVARLELGLARQELATHLVDK